MEGPQWTAQLHLATSGVDEIAQAANEGIAELLQHFDVDKRTNVDFTPEDYRAYARRVQMKSVGAALASALTAEWPQKLQKKDGHLSAAPLVMMFGQGHQNFLDRLVDVARGAFQIACRSSNRLRISANPARITEALFQPWRREDDADGFPGMLKTISATRSGPTIPA